jgi:hypothetical protein
VAVFNELPQIDSPGAGIEWTSRLIKGLGQGDLPLQRDSWPNQLVQSRHLFAKINNNF